MTQQMTYPGHARAITVMGLPLVGGHLGQIAIGVSDTVMAGWYSVEALAAVTLASTYFFVLLIFGSGFAWGVMPLVAAFDAEGDEVGLRRATRMGMWLSMGFAVLALPLMIWSRPIMALMGQDQALADMVDGYLFIAAWGIFPALMVMVLKSYLAALERTQVVLWITLLAGVANVLANYAFIFGNWGAPELGVRGAAIASVTSHSVSLVAVVIYVLWKMPQHQMFVRLWRPDWEMLARVFRLGLPIGFTGLSEVGLFAASAVMMGWLGTVALAAHGIALQLASITFMVHLGISNVATIRAGNAYGRRDPAHLARGAITATVMSALVAVLTIFVFVMWPEPLINLFMQRDEPARDQILVIGVGLLAMASLFQLVDGAQAVALGILRGVQDTTVPMLLAGFSYWIVGMPASYLLGFVFDLEGVGVWLGLVFGLGVAAILLNARFWGSVLKRLGPTDPAAA
ncbi:MULTISPECIES: MATE family efflux transporter [Sulfitobacter]|jgi:MATE family multidrug resistance protein|uniref:Multidrug-efflux transporter n=3 Tax=Sulfitobacter TaxID=60136 RepID=A0AAU8C6A5_9RHOB|nr:MULTISPECIES: MATE family efflux transporter [Sulfitobacter]MAJ77876.1 MATE family efflux transporter [Roseobacter sp.]NKX47451.1 MATE family efflux transporter [Rhodobacteraceae bacterium R_SAG8]AXI50661.1 MATE family efflux transporter [Sulfitobacter sp. SK025]EAP80264.1 MATE efflux family protein [Sulfitobacter sp. NAS-14.1]EAP83771.1 MATE efflux family protein [Sulfitobacter sp. EE-36]|tara:strand:- start:170 stop:1543 length:1374 start_codon:yes stop_codon:yes gene_type:complete